MNRGRDLFRLAMSRMNGIAIAANVHANGKRATKQNGVLAIGTEISGVLTFCRGAMPTAASTIPMGWIYLPMMRRRDGRPMPGGIRPRAKNGHTATSARWVKSPSTTLRSLSKAASLSSKSKAAALNNKSKCAVCARNRLARNVCIASGNFLSARPPVLPRSNGDKIQSIRLSLRSPRGSKRSITSVQQKA
jgi:hypothetical protein